MTATRRPNRARSAGLLGDAYRLPTLGIVIVVTLVAFEALAVATVMPAAVRDLGGLDLYGWGFTAFLLTNVVSLVAAGEWADRHGPARPFLTGLAVFCAGLVTAGVAPSMLVFIAGRGVQGLGAGAIIVAIYVIIARVYPESLRPRAFAVLSAAWVLPAVAGPALAGLVAERASWRWVFAALPPAVALGLLLLLPALASLPARSATSAEPPAAARAGRVRLAVRVAVGVGLLQYGGQQADAAGVLSGLAGALLLGLSLPRLLPAGALGLRAGLPAAVALRGLLAGAMFGAEAFVPLTLVELHDWSAATAGLPLTVGALGWAAGSWAQGRRAGDASPVPLVRTGFGLLAGGIAALLLLVSPLDVPLVAVPAWAVAGAGMGLAMPTLSVLTLRLSRPAEQGANSAALQISEVVASMVLIGAGGVVLAALTTPPDTSGLTAAIVVIDVAMVAVALLGVAAARRTAAASS